ncbi:MGDG synthase family glycosyltransferase [Anoxynatronum buryatiense]|uniref:Processive 1,2-diacylglycerol beta-glucosyltransferase n=1 Tax=Anoxynatronum buryatiense TaxID=489973 RepID=A0AA45WTV3_9CLOT|nr:glycosyltransferase [Anoxynatronum buryatiense]SMP43555.1 processive 1,2-diacylglycerol beta-glucosyltransferase [Anoxynatronum buryatiense]
MRTIVIVTASIGAGHNQVAGALKESLLQLNSSQQVHVIDLLAEKRIYQMVNKLYLTTIQKAPSVFSKAYLWTQTHQTNPRAVSMLHYLCYRLLKQLQQKLSPSLFIFTHPFPVAAYRSVALAPAYAVLTDFGYHPLWLNRQLSGYFVAHSSQVMSLRDEGIPASQLYLTGIPVKKGFAAPVETASYLYPLLNEPAVSEQHILIMGGGLGIGNLTACTDLLMTAFPQLHFVVVTGNNKALYDSLIIRTRHLANWRIMGFSNDIPRLMKQASLLITKAGAVSLSEAAVAGLPTIILNPLPGHEEENAALAASQGWALQAKHIHEVELLICQLRQHPERLHDMCQKARQAAFPEAAANVASLLQIPLEERGLLSC